jgi:ankyrin repeat protein
MAGYITSIRDSIGKTVLGDVFYAIENINDERAISFINSSGFDVNQINSKNGKTLLQTALEQLSYTLDKEDDNKWNLRIYKIIRALFEKNVIVGKAEIDEINNRQLMILIFLTGQFDIFKHFLKKGADPNVIYNGDKNNSSLLLIISERLAVLSRQGFNAYKEAGYVSEIMELLLENGADPNIANIDGEVPLTNIIDMNYLQGNKEYRKYWIENLVDSTQTLEKLVKSFFYLLKTHTNGHNSEYYIEYFLKKGGPDLIGKCYEEGILVLTNIMNSFDGTLTKNTKSLEIMKLLIDYGANADELDRTGYTLLQFLLDSRQLRKAMWLLQHGADPNLPRPDGKTPIMYAVEKDNLVFVKILLGKYNLSENDPDAAILSTDIIKKIDMTRTEEDLLWTAAESKNNSEIVGLLMEAGADQEYESSDGFSVLDIAVHYGNSLVCTALLENGFNVNKQNSIDNETAIFIATQNHYNNNNADILLQILIQNGGDPDLPNKNGDTPLILVASKKHADKKATDKEIVKLLIEYEANIEHRNDKGESALDVATKDIKPIIKTAMKSMENRRTARFDSSRIKVDENREVTDPINGTEALLKDYLMLDPSNKVLIIDNFTLGIDSEAFLEQFTKREYRYDNKYYECNNVQPNWPSRDDINWSTGAMLNLRAVGGPGGLVDFDIFIGLLNSPHRLFELREIRQIPAIAGLQMLHHAPGASSSEHCQGGTVYKYYNILKIGDESDRSPTESKSKRVRTVSSKYKTREASRGGKKTRRRRSSK